MQTEEAHQKAVLNEKQNLYTYIYIYIRNVKSKKQKQQVTWLRCGQVAISKQIQWFEYGAVGLDTYQSEWQINLIVRKPARTEKRRKISIERKVPMLNKEGTHTVMAMMVEKITI